MNVDYKIQRVKSQQNLSKFIYYFTNKYQIISLITLDYLTKYN